MLIRATVYDENMLGKGCDLNNWINSQITICFFDARFYIHNASLFTLLSGFATECNRDICIGKKYILKDKFLILANCSKKLSFRIFADDTNMLYTFK